MNRRMGIIAETALRRVLEAKGCQTTRNAASHGKFDVLAVLGGETAIFEVKATTLGSWSVSRSRKLRQQIEDLRTFATEGGLYPVVAIYWASRDEFELFSPDRVLERPVRPGDSDLEWANPVTDIPALPPKSPSPTVGSPVPTEMNHAAEEGW